MKQTKRVYSCTWQEPIHTWHCLSATSSKGDISPWTIFCISSLEQSVDVESSSSAVVVTSLNELIFFSPVIFDASQQCCMMMNSPQGALKAINLTCMRYTYIWNKTNFWAGTKKSAGTFQRRRQKMQISNSILTTSRRYGWRIFDHSLLFREICVLQAYENSFVTKVDDSWTLKRCLCSVYMRTDTI